MSARDLPQGIRLAAEGDVAGIARILSDAFSEDPLWGPAFPPDPNRPEIMFRYWSFVVGEALRHRHSLVLESVEGTLLAISIWSPPGENEISDAAVPALDALTTELIGAEAAAELHQTGELFENARPKIPHAYLTLLATDSSARGHGYGMQLLQAALDRYDSESIPTYLESSNPGNDARYERHGYTVWATVEVPDRLSVRTYWRGARNSSE